MRERNRSIAQLAEAVADRSPIDWAALTSRAATGSSGALVCALRSIDGLGLSTGGDASGKTSGSTLRGGSRRRTASASRRVRARSVLGVATLVSAVLLIAHVHRHCDQSLVTLLSGGPFRLLMVLTALGLGTIAATVASCRTDERWTQTRDDSRASLFRASQKLRRARSTTEALDVLVRAVEAAFGARCRALPAVRDGYASPEGSLEPIREDSALALLALAAEGPFLVDPGSPQSLFAWLPPAERALVAESGIAALVPVPGPCAPVALVALHPARDGAPYSAEDFQFMGALATACSLAIGTFAAERRALRSGTPDAEEPAGECRACGRLHASASGACHCGETLEPARLPYLLAGKFRSVRRLGAGSMGVVYEAEDLDLARMVALKTLPRVSAELAIHLRHEARSLARVLHPRLATIFGCEAWRGFPVLVLEHLAGTLASCLGSPWRVREALEVGAAAAEGLAALHAHGLLHRDVKPSNVGLGHDGEVKLLDLGVAHLLTETTDRPWPDAPPPSGHLLSMAWEFSSRVFGTHLYCSPERLEGVPAGPADDVWSLSMVLYELLAGAHPWRNRGGGVRLARPIPDLRELRSETPTEVARFFTRALSTRPAERPTSAADFRSALGGLLEGLSFAHSQSA